jgi:MFS family permease
MKMIKMDTAIRLRPKASDKGPKINWPSGDFGSTTSEIQLTLSFTMIGLALGQFIFGPLSDAFGRKRIAVSILIPPVKP